MTDFQVLACADCGHVVWPARLACSRCGAAEWTELPSSGGVLTEVTEAAGFDGSPVRLGTVHLDAGPSVIAAVAGAEAGDTVVVELVDGGLRARPGPSEK